MPEPPVIRVHSLAQALGALRAAARAGRPVVLASAEGAGSYLGPGNFSSLCQAARTEVPQAQSSALLDCGEDAGAALAAIRGEVSGVVFTGREDVAARLADIARLHGVAFLRQRPSAALDLEGDFFATAEEAEQLCAVVLAASGRSC